MDARVGPCLLTGTDFAGLSARLAGPHKAKLLYEEGKGGKRSKEGSLRPADAGCDARPAPEPRARGKAIAG